MEKFDFEGWASIYGVKCTDGRTIMQNAFKHNSGRTVPLVWNHNHNDPNNVLGKAVLEHRDKGVYAYCYFNGTEYANAARELILHGDVTSLSICANALKQRGPKHDRYVDSGEIREVSLVLASANPEAYIESVMRHGEEIDDEAIMYTAMDGISLYHSDEQKEEKEDKSVEEETKKKDDKSEDKTVKEVIDSMTEEQKTVMYAMVAEAMENGGDSDNEEDESKGGNNTMKHNVFDKEETKQDKVLSHADEMEIINLAKSSGVNSFQSALGIFAENNDTLAHGIDDIETLFPDYKDLRPGAPEVIQRDMGWVTALMQNTHKSPISRIRTRQADARIAELKALGHKKGDTKKNTANIKLLNRTTDPQTVYIKDAMHRDDIVDITDFDVVQYMYGIMQNLLKERIAVAAMIGDGLEEGDADKISTEHIRPIWTDDDIYTIHTDVDIEAARAELQGSNTSANFGENYIYAEAIVTAALYAREQYKGSGALSFYCTPHLLNVMLLARDLNGRRVYNSKADIMAALDVEAIYTAEQFANKTRQDKEGNTKKLLGIFVNENDYNFGATKGGEITKVSQFDIDFNQQKALIETRLSGALTKAYSAIALEEPVAAG